MVYRDKGLFATDVPMIIRPAPYHGIEQPNHIARCRLCMTFDDLSDVAETLILDSRVVAFEDGVYLDNVTLTEWSVGPS